MASLRQVIVDTDSAYSGYDYSDIQTADDNEQGDISAGSGSDEYVVFECYATSGTADSSLTIDGWTTQDGNYVQLNGLLDAAYGHQGQWTTDEYRIVTSNESAVLIYERYVHIIGIQVQLTGTNGTNQKCVYFAPQSSDEHKCDVSHCIIRGYASNSYDYHGCIHHYSASYTPTGNLRVWNNICYDAKGSNSSGLQAYEGSTTYYWYNNTVHNCTTGLSAVTGTVNAINNIAQGCTTGLSGSYNTNTDNVTSGVSFVNEVGDIFKLASDDTVAIDQGTDLYSDGNCPVIDDILKTTRPVNSVFDIGAHEWEQTDLEINVSECLPMEESLI